MNAAKDETKDKLTGALRGDQFAETLKNEISAAEKKDGVVSMLLADLDNFGLVNEKHGQEAGDEVIREIYRELATAFPHGMVFRYGGEEFTVLLPGVEKEQAFLQIERTRAAFDRKHEIVAGQKGTAISLSFSAGVASYRDDGVRPADLLRKAFDAMYRAKTSGRNRVCLAREERMVTKTSHYTQGQLQRLSIAAKRQAINEAALLREALDDLLLKYSV
jgi:diguanylate cyclase (GGDEF)-like protein